MWRIRAGLVAYTLAERPELLMAALAIGGVGEEFAGHDLVGRALAVGRRLRDHWPGYTVVLVDEGLDGDGVGARGCAVPLAVYGEDRREDGLPEDRWLRLHVRRGARIVKVAPFAMVVVEALDRWRAWTGQPFDASGPVAVRGGLVPVVCDLERDVGMYVEPNVWVRHEVGRPG